MANKKKDDLEALIAQAEELEDQSEAVVTSDFEYTPPPAGDTVGRFIEYVELGIQKQRPYKGKPRPDVEQVRFVFELLHPTKNIKEIEKDDGSKVKIADKMTLTLKKSLHKKASFFKLFDKMKNGREEIKHFARMLGEPFIITIIHDEVDKDGTKKTYARMKNGGEFLVRPPTVTDPITEETKTIAVPQALSPRKLFIWKAPTKESWDALFIDGEREVKDEKGGSKTVSKNWIQNTIKTAKNFPGSAIADMLEGSDALGDLDAVEPEGEDLAGLEELETETQEEAPAKPAATKKSVAQVKPPVKAAPSKATAAKAQAAKPAAKVTTKPAAKKAAPVTDDPLAALGLLG